jgi:hypothetical protein
MDFCKIKEQSEALYFPNRRLFKVHFSYLQLQSVSFMVSGPSLGTTPKTRRFYSLTLLGTRKIIPGFQKHWHAGLVKGGRGQFKSDRSLSQ